VTFTAFWASLSVEIASTPEHFGTVLPQRFSQAEDSIGLKSQLLMLETQVRYGIRLQLIDSMVGAGRFERPTPCAQGGGMANFPSFISP